MAKPKNSTKGSNAGGVAIARETLEKFDKEYEALETRVAVLEATDSPEIFARLEKLEAAVAALSAPIAASADGGAAAANAATREALQVEIRGIVREQTERYITESIGGKTFADFVGERVSRELEASGHVHAADAMGAAKLREEIATVVEQRLAAGFLEATSAQISSLKSELRELARDIAKDTIAEDKRTSSRRGHRSAVTPA